MEKLAKGDSLERLDLQKLSEIGAIVLDTGVPAFGEYKDYDFEVDENFEVTIGSKLNGVKPTANASVTTVGYVTAGGKVEIKVTANTTDGTITNIEPTNGAILKTSTNDTEKLFEVTKNGIYYFKITGSNGRKVVVSVEVNIFMENPQISIKDITNQGFTIVVDKEYPNGAIIEYQYYIDGILKQGGTTQKEYTVVGLEDYTIYTDIYVKVFYFGNSIGFTSNVLSVNTKGGELVDIAWTNNTNKNRTIDGKTQSYQNPMIPAGFSAIQTETAKWDAFNGSNSDWSKGLVIKNDSDGNEFVWIPVEDYSVFLKNEEWKSIYKDSTTEENYQSMIDSVKKHGGFYIGRYEAGQSEKKGQSRMSRRNSKVAIKMTKDTAQSQCQSYQAKGTITSSLMYGIQWDAVLRFIQKYAPTYSLTDSTAWGNYNGVYKCFTGYTCNSYASNSWMYVEERYNNYELIATGLIEQFKVQNIYDFAGNIIELTLEGSGVGRGGGHQDNGIGAYSASGRITSGRMGYRLSFYLK